MQNFDANSTNVTEVRTNELTNIRTDERKDESYIPLGINAGGIITTSLFKVLTSCLTAIKIQWIKYCEKTYKREGINSFWSIKTLLKF